MSELTVMKKCSKCGEEKPATAEYFHRQGESLRSYCKSCVRMYQLELYAARCNRNAEVDTDGYKRCSHCREEKPREDFSISRRQRDGLQAECKTCQREMVKRSRAKHPGQQNEYNRRWREKNRDKTREYNRRRRAERPEQVRENNRRWRAEHPDRVREYARRFQSKNPGWPAEKRRQYRLEHYEEYLHKRREYNRRKRLENPGKQREADRRYRKANADKIRVQKRAAKLRRESRKRNLPYEPINETRAFEYWHGHCAICDQPLRDLFGDVKPHLDHWIALSDPRPDNPGTVPTNMVPLCSKCNLSKHNHDPIEWLNKKYEVRKARQIVSRVEAYFEWVKNNQP